MLRAARSDQALRHSNDELKRANLQLQEARNQLLQSEKMASIGQLAAGVAHEINTPLGVSVTAASTLENRTQRMREDYAAGKLTRPELDHYAETAVEASRIILRNLQRAADLIKEEMEVMGAIRLREVEKAQHEIVAIARKLEEEGLLVTGAATALFPRQAGGSLVLQGGKPVGSELIGQNFNDREEQVQSESAPRP